MPERLCDLEECQAKHYGHGLCSKHYNRKRQTGDPRGLRGTGHRYVEKDPGERIAKRVEAVGDCLIYRGGYEGRGGHVMMSIRNRMTGVHRVAWELANGPIPAGMCVCHKCDVPRCVRPDHLFLGTIADNNRDRDEKGRAAPMPIGRAPQRQSTVHGTITAYVKHKCRCDECRAAITAYRRARRAA